METLFPVSCEATDPPGVFTLKNFIKKNISQSYAGIPESVNLQTYNG